MTLLDPVHARIVIVGDSAVGKTCIVKRLLEGRFDPFEQTTVGANWELHVQDVDGNRMELQIWDTAGQEKFRSLAPLYYRGACGAIVVYDVTSRPSFEMLASWIDSFVSIVGIQGTIVIAGNKCDLEDFRQVSREEAVDWAAKHGYEMFETSAKTGQNIQLLVDRIAEDVLKAKLSDMQNKPSGLAGGASHSSCC